jgi:hypothetical protein
MLRYEDVGEMREAQGGSLSGSEDQVDTSVREVG